MYWIIILVIKFINYYSVDSRKFVVNIIILTLEMLNGKTSKPWSDKMCKYINVEDTSDILYFSLWGNIVNLWDIFLLLLIVISYICRIRNDLGLINVYTWYFVQSLNIIMLLRLIMISSVIWYRVSNSLEHL